MSDGGTVLHRHHIVPKHAGGSDDESNIAHLTTEEHAEAHRELYEKDGRWQDFLAWQGLSRRLGREEIIRAKQIEANKARVWSDESKDKLRAADKSYTQTPEYRENMRLATLGEKNGFFGKTHSEEVKAGIRKRNSERVVSDKTRARMSAAHKKIKRERGAHGRFV